LPSTREGSARCPPEALAEEPSKGAVPKSTMLRLIDTHAHLDEIKDLDVALRDASDVGVVAIVAVGTGYDSNQRVLEISQQYKNLVYPALGLHPWQLGHMDPLEVERTLHQIEDNLWQAVAIGEVGLDYDKRVKALVSKDRQQAILGGLMGLAKKYRKPIIIHSRYAWKDALIQTMEAGIEKAVFHWYTGPSSILHGIIAEGYFISATPASEYHAEHRRAVREAPLLNLLLETDAPVEYGRESKYTSVPKDVQRSLSAVSEIKSIEEAALAEQTTQNALRFFQMAISP
jgi:TatD DNase family protein